MLQHIAVLTAAASAVGAALLGLQTPQANAETPAVSNTIELPCGGYDASGAVVNERAVEIGTVTVDATQPFEVPAVCGGYTADGTFIGDD